MDPLHRTKTVLLALHLFHEILSSLNYITMDLINFPLARTQQAPNLQSVKDEGTKELYQLLSFYQQYKLLFSKYWMTSIDPWYHLSVLVALQLAKGKIGELLSWTHRAQVEAITNGFKNFARPFFINSIAIVLVSPINMVFNRCLRSLRIKWTANLASIFLNKYVYMQSQEKELINVDQHISEDVDKFVDLSLTLFFEIFEALVHLSFLGRLLFQVSSGLSLAAVFASLLGTALTAYTGRMLSTYHGVAREASNEYRYGLTRVRENIEAIAFYNAERFEVKALEDRHLMKLLSFWYQKGCKDTVALTSSTVRKLCSNIPAIFLAMQATREEKIHIASDSHANSDHFHDHFHDHSHDHSHSHHHHEHVKRTTSVASSFGAYIQATEAFDHILYHLLIISENLNDFSKLKTLTAELNKLLNATEQESSTNELKHMKNIELRYINEKDCWLRVNKLSLGYPTGNSFKFLFTNLSFSLATGESLLIQGRSGIGKTTLLRALAGLWKYGSGTILRPSTDETIFIPQKPYMCVGTLRQQVLYPVEEINLDDDVDIRIEEALRIVNLNHLLHTKDGLDRIEEWSEVLSNGEQQRVAFARLLFSHSKYAILDEATSACDEQNEHILYKALSKTCKGWISVGHRKSIEEFHSSVLVLQP